jgi:glucan 1,3-beta-glucosidase
VQTKNAITALAQRYANKPAVTMIEAVNEPMGSSLDMSAVKQYYYDAWGTIRQSNSQTVLTIHDAFQSITDYWNGFMNSASGVNNVALDTHIYQIFTNDLVAQSPSQHVQSACASASQLSSTDKWTIVGEWTGAQTDCAKWLNGLGVGARYDGTYKAGTPVTGSCDGKYVGTVDALSSDDKKNLRSFIEAQLDSYEAHTGWIWWTWKTESAPEWDLRNLTAAGLFPQPLNDRQCKFSPFTGPLTSVSKRQVG